VLAELPPPERIAIIVGPEGGLTAEEVASAVKCGFIPVSLGKTHSQNGNRGLAIVAILQFLLGGYGVRENP